jgi:hypothetical protein
MALPRLPNEMTGERADTDREFGFQLQIESPLASALILSDVQSPCLVVLPGEFAAHEIASCGP